VQFSRIFCYEEIVIGYFQYPKPVFGEVRNFYMFDVKDEVFVNVVLAFPSPIIC